MVISCSSENKEEKISKSYSASNVTETSTDESLPKEKIKVDLKTPEPIANPNFRKVKWGMSKDEVKSRENAGSIIHDKDNTLGYDDVTVAGLNTYVAYLFVDDKLYRAVYIFDERYVNNYKYIADYNTLKDILTSKYGAPNEDKKTWLDDSRYYKDKPGKAVAYGKLIYYAVWTADNTKISLSLVGENYDPKLRIEYDTTDPKLSELVEKMKQQKNEADF